MPKASRSIRRGRSSQAGTLCERMSTQARTDRRLYLSAHSCKRFKAQFLPLIQSNTRERRSVYGQGLRDKDVLER